jgi:hypothetical protein
MEFHGTTRLWKVGLFLIAITCFAIFPQALKSKNVQPDGIQPREQGNGDVHFIATELLGRPTDTSITLNAVADVDLEVYLEYGTASGTYGKKTLLAAFTGGSPIEIVIDQLQPDTQYYYRMNYRRADTPQAEFSHRDEHSFHTQRSPGSSFIFTVQADSHLYDKKCVPEIYRITLENEINESPDFFLELGDTFGADKFLPPVYEEIAQLHLNQRPYLGIVGHSAPLFFVLGNHEGEAGYELDGTADNIVIYATKARKLCYPNPVPDGFYTGNSKVENYVGLPEDYYAWEWGDALFVVLDPYRYTTTNPKASGDLWDWTLGEDQYKWLKQTLEGNHAKFKFVFAHHVLGDMRGAVAWADEYEWGGRNKKGTWEFDKKRPGWAMPIHQLMVENGVTIFFQGHDHLFAKEELDGIVYQEVPQPSFPTGSMPNAEYYTGDVLPSSGHLRVKVSGSEVKVDYIRTYLPGEGTNGEVAYSYTITSSLASYLLTVAKEGTGSGTVTSSPDGIDCGSYCSESYSAGTPVTLTAAAASGSSFQGWSVGGCSGTAPCTLTLNGDMTVTATFNRIAPITLLSPPDNTSLTACSLYSPPTFSWGSGETFRANEVQFAPDQNFVSPLKVKVAGNSSQTTLSSSTLKKVLLIPGASGWKVFWRFVGTRSDQTTGTSDTFSLVIDAARKVGTPNVTPTSRGSLPTLSWTNNCNTKFRVTFGGDSGFVKKSVLSFRVTNPLANGGVFTKALTLGQWTPIRKLVGDASGSTVYWYVESWDGLGRYAKTDVVSFDLTD